jgi:hypothetical protein
MFFFVLCFFLNKVKLLFLIFNKSPKPGRAPDKIRSPSPTMPSPESPSPKIQLKARARPTLIETVNAIVSVKENVEFKCSEAFELFMLHSDLLKEAKTNEK